MNGRGRRIKGKVAEYNARDYFRDLGYEAIRVPLSGSSEGYKGDIEITLGGLLPKITAEVKSRKNHFKQVYALFDSVMKGKAGILPLNGISAIMSYHFDDLAFSGNTIEHPIYDDIPKQFTRTVKKIFNMQKWVESSQFLMVKDNYKRFLFIRYLW